ncbi:hypothetical protein MRX96_029504 [Rhipicephalus microplus]
MALFPLLGNRGSWGPSDLVRRFLDDDFGGSFLDGELFDPPFYHQRFYIQPRHQQQASDSSVCPARQQGTSVACTPDKFAISVDTRHFTPEEIKRQNSRQLRPSFTASTRKSLTTAAATSSLRARTPPKEQPKPIPIAIKHEGASGDAKKK